MAAMTGVQKMALSGAALVSICGAGLWGYGTISADPNKNTSPSPTTESTAPAPDGVPGFSPEGFTDDATAGMPSDDAHKTGDGQADGTESQNEGGADGQGPDRNAFEMYGPSIFRFGFAFFVGFAIAHALRAAFRLVIILAGVVLLLLIGLQMGGIITIHWDVLQGFYTSASGWLSSQTQSVSAFVRGAIPASGTTLAGFGMGLYKKS